MACKCALKCVRLKWYDMKIWYELKPYQIFHTHLHFILLFSIQFCLKNWTPTIYYMGSPHSGMCCCVSTIWLLQDIFSINLTILCLAFSQLAFFVCKQKYMKKSDNSGSFIKCKIIAHFIYFLFLRWFDHSQNLSSFLLMLFKFAFENNWTVFRAS